MADTEDPRDPPGPAPNEPTRDEWVAFHLARLRREIEALSDAPAEMGPADALAQRTPTLVPYTTFVNGELKEEGKPAKPAGVRNVPALVNDTVRAVWKWRLAMGGFQRLLWRLPPQIDFSTEEGALLRIRIAFIDCDAPATAQDFGVVRHTDPRLDAPIPLGGLGVAAPNRWDNAAPDLSGIHGEAKVVRAFGVSSTAPAGGEPEVVEMLERVLAEARRGEVTAVALAYVRPNRAACVDWTRGSAPANLVVAAVSHLWFRLMATVMDAVDG